MEDQTIHYIEASPDFASTLCGMSMDEVDQATQNPLHVTCEECKEDMRIAGTFMAMRMKLDRLQGFDKEQGKVYRW